MRVNAEMIGPAYQRCMEIMVGIRMAMDTHVEIMERMRVGWSKSNRVLSHSLDDIVDGEWKPWWRSALYVQVAAP